jgi:hypothetical protein
MQPGSVYYHANCFLFLPDGQHSSGSPSLFLSDGQDSLSLSGEWKR